MADNRYKINEILSESYVGKEIKLQGWVYRLRKQKDNIFIILRDGSFDVIQAIAQSNKDLEKLTRESSVEISGILEKDDRAPGGYELRANKVEITHCSEEFPIQKDYSTEHLEKNRHLWLRSRKLQNVMKIKSAAMRYARDFFDQKGWTETTPPIINRSACEGGATLFEMSYFGEKAYLSQSAQLYLEALIFSLGEVWSLTPSFRAEKSKTPRHLAEYWHLEGEAARYNFDDILGLEEELVTHIAHNLAKKQFRELELLGRNPADLLEIKIPFDRITYEEAIAFLNKQGNPIQFGNDLGTDDERKLTENSKQPRFLYGAPINIKPFYTKINPANPGMVLSADLIAPEGFGEITTGGQREEDLDSLVSRIKKDGFNPEDYSWYLDLRKYGSVPHSGFGLGIERIVRWICKLDHIRDAIPFPRTMKRAFP